MIPKGSSPLLTKPARTEDHMRVDPTNPVVALCAAGMAVEGDPAAARRLFQQAWDSCADAYEASIAAHFLARQQETSEGRLHWNSIAVERAKAVTDGRTREFLPSLYLNLADSCFMAGNRFAAVEAIDAASRHLPALKEDGYRTFVERGISSLRVRLAEADNGAATRKP